MRIQQRRAPSVGHLIGHPKVDRGPCYHKSLGQATRARACTAAICRPPHYEAELEKAACLRGRHQQGSPDQTVGYLRVMKKYEAVRIMTVPLFQILLLS